MKKLGKLSINVDKIMKNEELVNLKGGDYGYGEACTCTCFTQYGRCLGYVSSDDGNCYRACEDVYEGEGALGICGNHPEACWS